MIKINLRVKCGYFGGGDPLWIGHQSYQKFQYNTCSQERWIRAIAHSYEIKKLEKGKLQLKQSTKLTQSKATQALNL